MIQSRIAEEKSAQAMWTSKDGSPTSSLRLQADLDKDQGIGAGWIRYGRSARSVS